MADKKKSKLSDAEIEKLAKILGQNQADRSMAVDKFREAQGFKNKIKSYREAAKQERIAKTGYKTNRGDFFRGAGFENLGDFVEKFFDKKASKEEIAGAKSSIGYKEEKKSGAGFSLSTSKELLKRFSKVSSNVEAIRADVAYIKDRVSPKQFDAKKEGSKDGQTKRVQYDPFAPQGQQYRSVSNNGKISGLTIGKEYQKSAALKAASATHNVSLEKIIEKTVVKTTGKLSRKQKAAAGFVDPKEKSPFDDDLKNALAGDPLSRMHKDMNIKFDKVFKLLEGKSGTNIVLPDLTDLLKIASSIWSVVRFLTPVGLAAIVTGAIASTMKSDIEKRVDTGIDNIVKDVSKKKGSESDYYNAIDAALNSKSNTEEQKQYLIQKLQTSENLTKEERAVVNKYFETKQAREVGKSNKEKWDKLENELRKWLSDNFGASYGPREAQKSAKNAYADYFDSIKSPQVAPPTLSEFLAAAQAAGAPWPSGAASETAPAPPSPPPPVETATRGVIKRPEAAPSPPPAPPAPTTQPEPMEEIIVSSRKTGTGKLSRQNNNLLLPSKDVGAAIKSASDAVGVDHGLMLAIAKQESGFNPNAKADTSSATGLFQFIKSSWDSMVAKYGSKFPDLMKGPSDMNASAVAGALFIKENSEILKKNNIPVNATSIYASHFLGPGGALRLLSANPLDAAVDILGQKVAAANKSIFYHKDGTTPKTIADVQQFLYDKVGRLTERYQQYIASAVIPTSATNTVSAPRLARASVSPTQSRSGAAMDTGSRQAAASREAAAVPVAAAPVVVASAAPTPTRQIPNQKLPDAGTRPSDSSYNRAVAKDYSHPTAFTTVGTV